MDSFDRVSATAIIVACPVPNFPTWTKTGTRSIVLNIFFPGFLAGIRPYISPVTIDKAAGADRMRLIKLMIYAQQPLLLHFHVRSNETNCAQNRIYEPIDIHARPFVFFLNRFPPKNYFVISTHRELLLALLRFFDTISADLRIYLPETKVKSTRVKKKKKFVLIVFI